ncbi:hypothetical protein L6452_00102 [Arctium lappa]|uniref:Uncharacterized protein n=1 Tax=Arctium lappa TaxID=4217 RepID=A0ACB9FDS4_ARCLA|nr:hypothetical protein L6452_00102 [Arctium lappa]
MELTRLLSSLVDTCFRHPLLVTPVVPLPEWRPKLVSPPTKFAGTLVASILTSSRQRLRWTCIGSPPPLSARRRRLLWIFVSRRKNESSDGNPESRTI